MKRIIPIPDKFVDQLKHEGETGIGYQVVSVSLKDGRFFEQVATSEGCVVAVRGMKDIPFSSSDMASVNVNHKRWNFRGGSEHRIKSRAATA